MTCPESIQGKGRKEIKEKEKSKKVIETDIDDFRISSVSRPDKAVFFLAFR